MLTEEIQKLKKEFPDYLLYPIISYDIVNNFTEESIIKYLQNTYGVSIPDQKIHGDPSWYGRGSVLLNSKDANKIPDNWEDLLSQCFDELEFVEDEEEEDNE